MGGGLILGAGGVLSDEVFYPSRWAYNFGLISVRGLIGDGGGVGERGGGTYYRMYFFSR